MPTSALRCGSVIRGRPRSSSGPSPEPRGWRIPTSDGASPAARTSTTRSRRPVLRIEGRAGRSQRRSTTPRRRGPGWRPRSSDGSPELRRSCSCALAVGAGGRARIASGVNSQTDKPLSRRHPDRHRWLREPPSAPFEQCPPRSHARIATLPRSSRQCPILFCPLHLPPRHR
jgi:hypothetical protein